MHQLRPDICWEAFKKPTMEKQGSWTAGKRASILDIRVEGCISPDRRRLDIAS